MATDLSSLGYAAPLQPGQTRLPGGRVVGGNTNAQSSTPSSGGYTQSPSNYFQFPGGAQIAPFDSNAPAIGPGGSNIGSPTRQMERMQTMAENSGFSDPFGQNFSYIGSGQTNSIPGALDWLAGQSPSSPFDVNSPENVGATWTPSGSRYGPNGMFSTQSEWDAAYNTPLPRGTSAALDAAYRIIGYEGYND